MMRAFGKLTLGLIALGTLAGAAGAADSRVSVQASGGTLLVQPLAAGGDVQVRVSGPEGFVAERTFAHGESAALDLAGRRGLADGEYRYEVTVGAAEKRARGAAAEARAEGYVESGTFRVAGGAIQLPSQAIEAASGPRRAPGPSPEDIVFADDVIIQGSTCVGLDCVNNESFGFDTIRLKENNLRINFTDTSTGAFPTNDWELTANDSASGGASRFSITDLDGNRTPFTITAGATTNSIFVDSGGRVGLRTSTPVLDLHIKTSNTPALRMEQDNSGGFTAQTWDIGANEANFFVRDVTGGSKLPFRVRPGAPTSSIDVNSSGFVGIGQASPTKALHVLRSDGNAQVFVQETAGSVALRTLMQLTNNGAVRYNLANTATGISWAVDNAANNHYEINNIGNAGVEFSLDQTGNLVLSGTITAPSDRNAKTDIVDVDAQDVLAKVAALPISTWRYKQDSQRHMGPMAQDFAAAFGLGQDDKHIALPDLSGVALAAIQALNQVVEQKDAQLKALEQQNAELAARLAAIEKALAEK